MGRKKFNLVVLFIISLIFLARSSYGNYIMLLIPVSVLALLSSAGLLVRFSALLKNNLKRNNLNSDSIKRKLILFILFFSIYLVVKKAAPKEWIIFTQDNATFLFFGYLSLAYLIKISSAMNGYFAIVGVILMAFYSLFKLEPISETFAILTFFFFTIAVLQAIKEQLVVKT